MKWVRKVATPPVKPVMVYDGACAFCKFWIQRWWRATNDRIEYLPLQDSRLRERFPEIPQAQFETAVHLIETNGEIHNSAEAVFRSLSCNPRQDHWLRWYQHYTLFANVTEFGYRLVSRHRQFLFQLTRIFLRTPR